jgi:hypothetical protein
MARERRHMHSLLSEGFCRYLKSELPAEIKALHVRPLGTGGTPGGMITDVLDFSGRNYYILLSLDEGSMVSDCRTTLIRCQSSIVSS